MANTFTTTSATPTGSSYTYALNSDLDLQWGKANIDKWADADNDNDAVKILARRAWALSRAERYVNGRLKGAFYTVPFVVGSVPIEIRDLVTTFAGIYLYSSPRGLVDGDDTNGAMMNIKDDAEMQIRNIIAGNYKLSGAMIASAHPAVVLQ